jgi:hypothetical protein
LVIIDEFGSWLSRITSKSQTGNVNEIPGLLQTLWGWPPENVAWKSSIKVGKDVKGIFSPAFSLLGFSTEEKFFASLKRSDAATGFINRLSLWNAGRGWTGDLLNPKYPWTQIPAWFGEALKDLTAIEEAPLDAPMLLDHQGYTFRDFCRMRWGDGAEDIYKTFEKGIRGMPDEEDREIWIRAPEVAVRNATKVAFFRGSSSVDVEDITWAIGVATESTKQLQEGHREFSKEDLDQADLVRRIRDQFKRKSRLTWGQVRKSCERQTGDYRKIEAAIKHLEEVGEIAPAGEDGRTELRGRPTMTWLYLRRKPAFL